MSFTNAITNQGMLSDGRCFEEGTYNASGVTTGPITCGLPTSGSPIPFAPVIGKIDEIAYAVSNTTGRVVTPNLPTTNNVAAGNQLVLTVTSGDVGVYRLVGRSAG